MLIRAPFRIGEDPVTRLLTLFIAFAFGLCAVAAPVPRERVPPDDRAIKKRFYDCWHEEWIEERDAQGGVTLKTKPSELMAYQFGEKDGRYWDWDGSTGPKAAYPVRLDTTRTPMRFEKFSMNADGTPSGVVPGIFKFDGPRLILAYPTLGWRRWNASGEYPNRPKDFEPRPGVVIAVLERCEYLDQYRPPERVPKPR
jgi:hypothetical protein